MIPPTLTTDRLIICAAEPTDVEPHGDMWGDPETVQFIGGATRTRQDAWFALARGRGMWPILGFGYWIVRDRNTGGFLGEVGFADFKRGMTPDLSQWPEAGWVFAKPAWGRGIATEAVAKIHAWLDEKRPSQSVCIIDPSNIASQTVARRVGYELWTQADYGEDPVNIYRRNAPPAS